MPSPSTQAERLALLYLIYQDGTLAADRRIWEAAEVARRLLTLQVSRSTDRTGLAAAIAEQVARTKLADQAQRSASAARDPHQHGT